MSPGWATKTADANVSTSGYGRGHDKRHFNGYTKSPTEEDTEQPARRRIRGYAYQALAVALNILASNLHKIASWLNRTSEPAPEPTTPRSRRANAAPDLADYLPDPNGPPLAIPA